MASRKTVTLDNLMALGPEHLATILVELADGNAEVKRRLRLELAAQTGGNVIAAEIGKRLAVLRSARSFIDWQRRRDFVKDLDLQRAMIVDRVTPTRADLALDLMWRFMDLAEPVLNRVDDSTGSVGEVFRAACKDLGTIAAEAKPDGPVANSGVGRMMGCTDPGFTLCWPPEVRSRPTEAGSARIPSTRRRSQSPCATTTWLRTLGSSVALCGRTESRRSVASAA